LIKLVEIADVCIRYIGITVHKIVNQASQM
jgi:hypothetical protein